MKPIFANSLDVLLDWDEHKIKRKMKGKGGGQFASKAGAKGGSASTKSETGGPAIPSASGEKPVSAPAITPEMHAIVATYQKLWPRTYKRFSQSMAGRGQIDGRVKSVESVHGKMTGKYQGRGLDALEDMLGLRCTSKTPADVYKNLEEVKRNYKVYEADDKMTKGQGFYRAVHLTVDSLDKTGNKRAEIQLRTERQSNVADWGHDIAYKGKFAKHPEVQAYAKAVSDANWELDNGREAAMPEPPEILKQHGLDYKPDKQYVPHWVAKEKPEFQ